MTNNWQNMETAPMDGTRVLLYRKEYVESMTVGFWHNSYEQWGTAIGALYFNPTHWMPLPDSPTE